MSTLENRKAKRVAFARGFDVWIMAIDGTWRRECLLKDVSENGAQLVTKTSLGGLNLKEFFLLLSTTGLAFRRCELAWVNGDQLGVNFIGASKAARSRHVGAADE
jgi:hypothetical protein